MEKDKLDALFASLLNQMNIADRIDVRCVAVVKRLTRLNQVTRKYRPKTENEQAKNKFLEQSFQGNLLSIDACLTDCCFENETDFVVGWPFILTG